MRVLLIFAIMAGTSSPLFAGEAGSARKEAKDPNRVICRTEEVIGSRLQTARRCMTSQQWQALRQEERTTIERVQAFKPNKSG